MLLGCSVKKKLFKLFFGIILIATAAISICVYMHNIESFAANNNVTITPGVSISYGGWGTYKYSVSSNGEDYTGFCVEPKKSQPSGSYKSEAATNSTKNKKIKLLLYAYRGNSGPAKDLFNSMFGIQDFTDSRYAYTHALAGYIYTNASDTSGLDASDIARLERANNILSDVVNNENSEVWAMAKDYQLYSLANEPSTEQNIMWIVNERETGNLKIKKCDTINTTCNPSGAASFDKVTFRIIYTGDEMVYDNYRSKNVGEQGEELVFYRNGDIVKDEVKTGTEGEVTVVSLPPGQYKIIETGVGENDSLVFQPSEQTITISGGSTKTATFKNQIVRGNVSFIKQNDDGEPMANIPFKIKSTTTGEEHIVVSDENGLVDTGANPHSNNTNGYDSKQSDPSSITYQGYGTWFGLDGVNAKECDNNGNCTSIHPDASPIKDELGALPYDTYEITEIACEQNSACHDIDSQKKTFTITLDGPAVELGTWENDCTDDEEAVVYKIDTVASDNEDGDKTIAAEQSVIKDTVEYCAKAGEKYTIKGILMNKSTGEPLLINGKTIESQTTVEPSENCDTVEMLYHLDATGLGGTEIVVFEGLFSYKMDGDEGDEELLASHEDINDESQTISVAIPTPNTGHFVSQKNDNSENSSSAFIPAVIVVTIGGYSIYRMVARRKFLIKK